VPRSKIKFELCNIGTAIAAQFHFTGNTRIDWNVYSGRYFVTEPFDSGPYDIYETNHELFADLLANDLILGWVSGKYEIGPRFRQPFNSCCAIPQQCRGAAQLDQAARAIPTGLHPNYPPVISRVRRLFRPYWGVWFVVLVSCSYPVFPAALHSLRAAEKLSGLGSEVGAPCTAPASSAGQAVRATSELP
jgi:hypothetical protein